ncbi:hypothetical protein, unlikely [Trypanosoma brucei gambiense DAL972]|uniref:Uncharacterized protein n=1 Tax=Trypanosoma brucei gambiense (strain MHOM/CI/86/DAL972) TaxID=679716 RepID=C9ZPB1_TRYB9|nr:hypothetical protein, unlikely [Trypanosoma brucei gambiense DAL972]CBH11239.1 hypothetical protein, unlikely [Trypanosoma brucei gambiense DAL972]|eukprot:XP_011773526.1 hypothetical protein, unlikely [Trypanosoma brucei gambiense DAL972]
MGEEKFKEKEFDPESPESNIFWKKKPFFFVTDVTTFFTCGKSALRVFHVMGYKNISTYTYILQEEKPHSSALKLHLQHVLPDKTVWSAINIADQQTCQKIREEERITPKHPMRFSFSYSHPGTP